MFAKGFLDKRKREDVQLLVLNGFLEVSCEYDSVVDVYDAVAV